jgi:uncharacterized protein YndB with AHSA1/START domain
MNRVVMTGAIVAVLLATGVAAAAPARILPVSDPADRLLRAELTLEAPVAEVWAAWTTGRGMEMFFAPEAHVDLRVDGTYDVWFFPQNPPGGRGAEGMRILCVEPHRRFAFTWDAPPSIPTIRAQRTMVVVDFDSTATDATRLRFTHLGWGEGPDWDQAYDYFDRAWRAIVLPRLVRRFAQGPIDWKAPPDLPPVAETLKRRLVEAE